MAGIKLAELIRANDKEAELTMLGYEGHYPCDKDGFFDVLLGKKSKDDIVYKKADFFDKENIVFLPEQKVTRINFQRKKIYANNKSQFSYDQLLLVEAPKNIFPGIRGTHKQGVWGWRKLAEVEAIAQAIPLSDTFVIQSDLIEGLQLSAALVSRGKEVILVCPKNNVFLRKLPESTARFFMELLSQRGVRFMDDNPISEILGDSHVKAIRLESGKIIACQGVIFNEPKQDMKLFQDLTVDDNYQIEVDANCQAAAEAVIVADSLSQKTDISLYGINPSRDVLENQANAVADILLEQPGLHQATVPCRTISVEDLTISFIGHIEKGLIDMGRSYTNEEDLTGMIVYEQDTVIKGAILLNKEEEKEATLKMIRSATQISPQNPCAAESKMR